MFDAIKPLLDSKLITEEMGREISEAWETKVNETREQVREELREEFAQRYEHDKTVMVEALDRMVTEGLQAEIQKKHQETQALAEDRVRFQKSMKENATRFNQFMTTKLAEEISELRQDRNQHHKNLAKLEEFITAALAREITEFAQDKRDLVETKVRLIREARSKMVALKQRFVKESAERMSQAVSQHLRNELGQLREDIRQARENNFGRRIFEAYAAEFSATHLNERAELRRLRDLVNDRNNRLAEAVQHSERAQALVEQKNQELRKIRATNERNNLMIELLSPLNQDKAQVMRGLLENVQTDRLRSAFEKYLPAVLEDRNSRMTQVITESVTAVTGDKTVPEQLEQDQDQDNVIELKRLAGL